MQSAGGLLQGEAIAFQAAFDGVAKALGKFGEAVVQQG